MHREVTSDSLSVWLVPEKGVREALAAEIGALAARYGTPAFEPHVTLLSGLPPAQVSGARGALADLASRVEPLTIRLMDVGQEATYFRCLFVRVECTAPLLAAHESARRAFAAGGGSTFSPHLSLVYGTLSEEERRIATRGLGGHTRPGFVARNVQLWSTRGRPESWSLVEERPLIHPT